MTENAVVGRDEILPLSLHHHMRTFHRLNRVDRDDVNRPGRETTEAILEREARLRHIKRLYLVRHINNGCGR